MFPAFFKAAGRRARALLTALTLCVLAPVALASAQSPDLDRALERLPAQNLNQTGEAIGEIVASGVPHAEPLLDALLRARLQFDPDTRRVYYEDGGGALFDARTGQPVAETPARLTRVRVNNRLRRQIGEALGEMRLRNPDRRARIQASETIFRAASVEALPALEAALGYETDPGVRRSFEQARAAILVAQAPTDPAERARAISILRDRANQSAVVALRRMPADAGESARAQADEAIEAIERRLAALAHAQNLWYGLSLGSVLLLAAIGLAITFGVMGVINMAHGEMVMLGAYTTFVVQEIMRAIAPGHLDWSLPIALPLAFLVTGLVGVCIERGVIRFLYGRPLETLLATWGVSLILQQSVRSYFGPTNREVSTPSYMSGSFDFLGLSIGYGRLWIVVFSLVLFVSLLVAIRFTRLGLYMRAVTQNRKMAAAMGIRTPWVDAMTFGLGSGVAGLAGVALSQIENVSPNLGQTYIIDSFMVVVFGGVGSLWGTLVSAFTLGIANKFLEPYAGAVLGKIIILVLLILFIQKRPRGLFALRGRAVES